MRRPRVSAEAVTSFLLRSKDDECCAWLCKTAGKRTREQELGLMQAVRVISPGVATAVSMGVQ